MEPRSYLSQPPRQSESRLLRDLYALNRQFLGLLLGDDDRAGSLLEPWLLAKLSALSDAQLERLATCPYSLFDLRFADAAAWRDRPQQATAHPPRLDGRVGYGAPVSLAALLFARQLADHYPDLARLLLGMSNDVARLLADQTLPTLTAVAFARPPWLEARLAGHPHFWPDLIDLVREGTQERYLAAQTLGVQQSASKL